MRLVRATFIFVIDADDFQQIVGVFDAVDGL